MTTGLTFIQLPMVSEYRCIDGVIKKIYEYNEDCSLDSKINQLALVLLAEVAALCDICTEVILFFVEVIKDVCSFTFFESLKIKKLFFSTLKISYFFIGLIPFLIQSQLDFKKLSSCIETQPKAADDDQIQVTNLLLSELQATRKELELKEEELSMRTDLSSNVYEILGEYETLMDPNASYFDKFGYEPSEVDSVIKSIDLLIFWTTTKNHQYLLSRQLSPEEIKKCQDLNSFYRTLLAIHRVFGKLYSFESINIINQLFQGELNDIEKMVGYSEFSKNVHKKIFWTFKKLFQLFLSIKDISERKTASENDHDSIEILQAILFNTYALFDDHLRDYHPDLSVHTSKPISLKKSLIQEHFPGHRSLDETLSALLEACSLLETRNNPHAKLANGCIRKSLQKCRNVTI